MRKRTTLHKIYLTHSTAIKGGCYTIERKLEEFYCSQEQHDETVAVNNIKSDSKYFFTYARKKAKLTVPIGPLEDSTRNLVSDPGEMAIILSNQYKSAFSSPAPVE